jgi:hypothetical protein
MHGQYDAGQLRGVYSTLNGTTVGTLSGNYENGSFHAEWVSVDGEIDGVLGGKYVSDGNGTGQFKGQWKTDCSNEEPVPMPKPTPPRMMCKKVIVPLQTTAVEAVGNGTVTEVDEQSIKPLKLRIKVVCRKAIPYGDDVLEGEDDGITAVKPTDVKPIKPTAVKPLSIHQKGGPEAIDVNDISDKTPMKKPLDAEGAEDKGGFTVAGLDDTETATVVAASAIAPGSLLLFGLRRFILL